MALCNFVNTGNYGFITIKTVWFFSTYDLMGEDTMHPSVHAFSICSVETVSEFQGMWNNRLESNPVFTVCRIQILRYILPSVA